MSRNSFCSSSSASSTPANQRSSTLCSAGISPKKASRRRPTGSRSSKSGEQPFEHERREGILEKEYPNDFLRQVAIIDTPGTNAIIRHHEELSRGFVPRSDLVLFVTSSDRPF